MSGNPSERPPKRKAESSASPSLVPELNLDTYYEKLGREQETSLPMIMRGRVRRITGMVIKARLPNAKIGEMCTLEPPGRPPVQAQVVGFDDEDVFLTPLDPLDEIGPKTPVISSGKTLRVAVGPALLGRVLNSLGEPIDGKGPVDSNVFYSVRHPAPDAMERRRITRILPVGIRAIDALMTIGEGQRVGVFSAAGVGKSSLLGMIARSSNADVNVVALVGERGREVKDFLEEILGPAGLAKSVVVVSTSDEPPLRRILAAYSATAIAEYFRDQGKRVTLLMDSVTRFARALREIALSVGEPPARQGYPPSVFATLPELLERAGSTETGSITAFYTILLASEQIEDPLGEEIRAILDGHLYLSAKLSYAQHYPAIDLLRSNSRVMQNVVQPEHRAVAERIRKLWATYEDNRDLISLGAYKKGNDADVDEAIAKRSALIQFLVQSPAESDDLEKTLEKAKVFTEVTRVVTRFFKLIFLVLAAAIASAAWSACGSKTFPELESGSYVGTISSVVKGSDRSFSFYAERLGSDASLLFVVFAEGWNPQVVAAASTSADGKKKGPVRLSAEGVAYVLSGTPSGGGFSGEVQTSDGRRGTWSLQPIAAADLKKDATVKVPGIDLKTWLFSKVKYNMSRDELDSLKLSFEQERTKLEKLERFVKDEDVLRDRSRSRKDALADELNRITEQRKKSTQDIKDALADLSLLHRYTKAGQVIDLNRRISRRENKWYSINWASGGSAENVEEQLAEQEQIDLKKLNAAVKHAEEIRRLQVAVQEEQSKIYELESALQRRVRTVEPPPTREEPPPEEKRERPWWRAWEG